MSGQGYAAMCVLAKHQSQMHQHINVQVSWAFCVQSKLEQCNHVQWLSSSAAAQVQMKLQERACTSPCRGRKPCPTGSAAVAAH